jgi:hypothetical protein
MTTTRYYIQGHAATAQRIDAREEGGAGRLGRVSHHPAIVAERASRVEIYAEMVASGDAIEFIPQERHIAADEDHT